MTKPRSPVSVMEFVDSYCELYQDLFFEVRNFEYFKYIHLGMISDIKRKSLPAIAKIAGLENEQGLHHFLARSPWKVSEIKKRRLEIILQALKENEIILIIDETGDKKKGKKTDYVKRQYIGNLGKVESGIVCVTIYGYYQGITFPLLFEVYKPKERLKEKDKYKSKPQIAAEMLRELIDKGFKISLILADSLYGESGVNFIDVLYELKLRFIVAIRSNHTVWLPPKSKIRHNKWRSFERVFSNNQKETRYIREIIFGKRKQEQFWQVTTDTNNLPENSTWYLMSYLPGIKYNEVGNLYGIRTWVEYGLKQSKNELGWADFRVTNYDQIEKWWELVMSAYLMVSLHSEQLNFDSVAVENKFQNHEKWNQEKGWKNLLNNIRLIIEPLICFNIIKSWLKVFPIPPLYVGFQRLISIMNCSNHLKFLSDFWVSSYYSSA